MKCIVTPVFITVLLLGCDESAQDSTEYLKDKVWVVAHQNSKDYLKKKAICDKRKPMTMISMSPGSLGPSLGENRRPAQWAPQQKYLGDTCFVASVGPYYYRDEEDLVPDYYSVEVEVRYEEPGHDGQTGESWRVLYRRDFKMEDLPVGFEYRSIDDIVEFNEASQTAIFRIGGKIYEFRIPMH